MMAVPYFLQTIGIKTKLVNTICTQISIRGEYSAPKIFAIPSFTAFKDRASTKQKIPKRNSRAASGYSVTKRCHMPSHCSRSMKVVSFASDSDGQHLGS